MSVFHVSNALEDSPFSLNNPDLKGFFRYSTVSVSSSQKLDDSFGLSKFYQKSALQGSTKAQEKNIFGEFRSEHDYLTSVAFLFSHTKETYNRAFFIKKLIKEKLLETFSALELGVGDGEVSRVICSEFREITLVDNRESLFQLVPDSSFPGGKVRRVISDAESCDYFEGKYNSIFASHILYYIDHHSWGKFLRSLYEQLADGGALFIVLSGGGDKEKIARTFGGSYCDINQLITCASDVFGSETIEVYDIEEKCEVASIDEALCVSDVYLNDSGARASKASLSIYLNKNNKIPNSAGNEAYLFRFTQRILVIQKR